ncbi:DUF302 domain-containing protein [Halomonas sediminis]
MSYHTRSISTSRQHSKFCHIGAALLAAILMLAVAFPVAAETQWPEEGWQVMPTQQSYAELLESLREAVPAEGMAVVTEAGPTEAAAQRGETIPGNRVVGVFRNDFAVRALRSSVPAMIEAPVRFYVTEQADGTATLSWKTPTHVFTPYAGEGDENLLELAKKLDAIFMAIADRATQR